MSAEPTIVFTNVSKWYGDTVAVAECRSSCAPA